MSFTKVNLKGIAKRFRAEPIDHPPALLDTTNEFPSHAGFRVGVTHPRPDEPLG